MATHTLTTHTLKMKRRFLFDHGHLVGGGNAQARSVKTGELSVRASFVPDSLNEEARTVDVCFATDTPVLMGYWERYYEILSFEDGHCDMTRLDNGAPMLDNHNRWGGAAEQPGVVERAWIKDGKGYATLRFKDDKSNRDGVPDGPGEKIFQGVRQKIVRGVSVGYTVQKYEEVDAAGTQSAGLASDNKIPTYRAILWQPFEISFAPVQADINAGVRAGEEGQKRSGENSNFYQVPIIVNNSNQDTDEMKRRFIFNSGQASEGAGGENTRQQGGGSNQPNAAGGNATENNNGGNSRSNEGGGDDEATRSAEIMELCEIAGFGLAETRKLISDKKTPAQVRAIILERKEQGEGATQHGNSRAANAANDERRAAKRKAVEDALVHRAAPGLFPLSAEGREFRGFDMNELAREFVEDCAPNHARGKSKREIAEAALNCGSGRSGMMSTSDLPQVLGNVVNRVLMAAYESQPSEWRALGRQTSFKDFRQKTIVQLSEGADMNLVKEGGEYERMKISDGKTTIQAFKYGRIIPITWETFVNDDLDALGRIPMMFAEMAARKQADLFYAPIIANSAIGMDNVALFHANHGNLLAAAAINIDSMGLMRKAFRKQKGPNGKEILNLFPKFMVVGPDMEQLALQYTSSNFVPTQQSNENPWKGAYQPIVEPRITGNAWFGVADPNRVETAQYGFLEGEGELFTTQREGFEVDGVEIKARMVFGCGIVDYRGWAKNPGA